MLGWGYVPSPSPTLTTIMSGSNGRMVHALARHAVSSRLPPRRTEPPWPNHPRGGQCRPWAASRLPVLRGGYHHSTSQQRLRLVRALLPTASLRAGGRWRIARVLRLLSLEQLRNRENL